eukprot:TRINITY_DN11459_c0_g1_i1.p1 TRINITY_DN11459_c0_g1~~TRINITY_DN11459_c0_g1_i1.p1  ORF type:complete len:336 (-),score=53.77 TRINITY_DN11459_c0_g1_i1:83-1090(-)
MRKGIILLLLLACCQGRILFFGKTHSGKTTLINRCCGLDLPVAESGQFVSTTKEINAYDCLGTQAIDTIGIFDYDIERKHRFDVKETLEIILANAAGEGLSGMVWIWPSKETVGSHEFEEIFETLLALLPDVIPIAIVRNNFPHLHSQVPEMLSQKYNLELLEASKDNTDSLKKWISKHQKNYKIVLPEDWKNQLVRHDKGALRSALLETTLLSCDTVIKQLNAISDKLASTEQPAESCKCQADCRMTKTECTSEIFGFCVSKSKRSWIDTECQKNVERCYTKCLEAYGKTVAETDRLLENLNDQFAQINGANIDLFRTCDKWHLAQKDLPPKDL